MCSKVVLSRIGFVARNLRTSAVRLAAPLSSFPALGLLLCAIVNSAAAQADEKLVLLPEKFTLSGPLARQTLLVERQDEKGFGGGFRGPPANAVEDIVFASSKPEVVEIVEGVAIPKGNGTATITVCIGSRSATAEVAVENFDQEFSWSFRNHVESVLTKTGCNSGACHGAALGKKGFRLTLRGYDPSSDFAYITRQARGRRVVPGDPGRSLFLLKPTGAVPHAGGVRLDVGSLEYEVIAQWLAAGTPPPRDDDPHITSLEILPKKSVLDVGQSRQLVVRAHFSDGRTEDVTRWAKYNSTNESVIKVGDRGGVQVIGEGEGAVTAWYLSQVVVSTISVPYRQQVDPALFAASPKRNFIDELALAKLRDLNLPPSPPCTDAEFLRRAYLHSIGVLPTPEETRVFLADASPDKRDQLIEKLLIRPEFVDYWSYKWSDLLLLNSDRIRPPAMWAFYDWIRRHVASNTPWDKFIRELMTANGSTLENGATNFFVLHQDPQEAAETTTQAFLGLSIGCAKCHNHPLEKWTNAQYFAMSNLFARVRMKEAHVKEGMGDGHKTIFNAAEGNLIQPLSGKPQPPQPLDGQALPLESTADRRAHLADWLVSPQNAYFSRAIVNRVWANFMGVGLVEAVDDLRQTNPASNEELLAALSDYLVKNNFDLKSLMRAIMQSQAYQRSSQPLPQNKADTRFYSRFYPQRLPAEVLLDAIAQATDVPTKFKDFPAGYRALQLPDSNIESYFLKSFGRPERVLTCECERTAQPSMVQVLHIANGDTINARLEAKDNRIDKLLAGKGSDEQIIEEAYLSCLSRLPTAQEREQLLAVLQKPEEGTDRRQVLEDLFWALLSSKEFLFNH